MLKKTEDIKEHYDSDKLIQGYIKNRFSKPLGRFIHEKEIDVVNSVIRKVKPDTILDLACGPARLTIDIDETLFKKGVAFDNAQNMLDYAKARLKSKGKLKKWKLVQGDAFKLDVKEKFDLVYTFRFFRHFDKEDRNKILKKLYSKMNKDAILITDMANKHFTKKSLRKSSEKVEVVDFKVSKQEFVKELEEAGFKVEQVVHLVNQYKLQVNASRLYFIGMKNCPVKLIKLFEKMYSRNPQDFIFIAKKQ
jgi:ubiquinone/menaquinone biosynthesis C-methylase UbiE